MIGSLAKQSDRNFELIIVDQNVDDRLCCYVAQGRAWGLSISHERMYPPNLSRARNHGVRLAQGEIVGFPDDDCWYEPRVIECVRERFLSALDAGGVVARWEEQAVNDSDSRWASGADISLAAWRRFRGGNASSVSLFVRRDLFLSLNGFDGRLGVGSYYGAGEEIDFLLTSLAAGSRWLREPQAIVHHKYSQVPTGSWRDICARARARGRGTGAIYAKHRLSAYVIARGFAAPFLLPLLTCRPVGQVLRGLFTALGRIEGLLTWKLREQ